MAKKTVWKDNTMPPTNYYWLKTDDFGNVLGLYENNGDGWVKLRSSGGNTPQVGDKGTIVATDLNGDKISIVYSVAPVANSIVVRTENGNVKTTSPIESDDSANKEYVDGLLTWKEN